MNSFYTTEPEAVGGAVVFSFVVNEVRLCRNGLLNSIRQHLLTLYFRLNLNRIISRMILECNRQCGTHFASYTIRHQRGMYVAPDGKRFIEPSIRLELLGSTKEDLTALGRMLLEQFHQRSVMIIDLTTGTKFHVRKK